MKRPRIWLRWFFLFVGLLVVGQYLALTRLVPRYVLWLVQYAAGGEIAVDHARWSLPLTTTLSGLRLVTNTPQTALTIQRAVIVPRWRVSVPSKTLWLERLEIDRPVLRLTRTKDGTVVWPSLLGQVARSHGAIPWRLSSIGARPLPPSWTIHIDSLTVTGGVIEIVDERPATPFHGVVDHLSCDLGPVTIPWVRSPQVTAACRARVVGDAGHAAPLYGSGWLDLGAKDAQISCKLDPLPLAAFEPYFQGSPELRVYAATLAMTSQWSSRANALTTRIQIELGNLREGDLSIGGRTIVDVKRITPKDDPRLTAEISVAGPLDNPAQWRAEFLPGNQPVHRLVDRLLEHGVQVVRLPLWAGRVPMSIVPTSQATMTDIEAAAKEIREALEILAVSTPEERPPASPEAAGAMPTAPSVATPSSGGPAPSSESPSASPSPASPPVSAPAADPRSSEATVAP